MGNTIVYSQTNDDVKSQIIHKLQNKNVISIAIFTEIKLNGKKSYGFIVEGKKLMFATMGEVINLINTLNRPYVILPSDENYNVTILFVFGLN